MQLSKIIMVVPHRRKRHSIFKGRLRTNHSIEPSIFAYLPLIVMSSSNLLPCSIKLLYLMLVTVITSLATPVTRLAIYKFMVPVIRGSGTDGRQTYTHAGWNVNEKYNLELLYIISEYTGPSVDQMQQWITSLSGHAFGL